MFIFQSWNIDMHNVINLKTNNLKGTVSNDLKAAHADVSCVNYGHLFCGRLWYDEKINLPTGHLQSPIWNVSLSSLFSNDGMWFLKKMHIRYLYYWLVSLTILNSIIFISPIIRGQEILTHKYAIFLIICYLLREYYQPL